MMNPEEVAEENLANAFPAAMRADALRVIAVMPRAGTLSPTADPIQRTFHIERPLTVCGEPVHVPSRIYHDPMKPSDVMTAIALTPAQFTILGCLYTRHNDGRVRQRWLRTIVGSTQPWVAPFVVNLVGEYVVEIMVDIRRALPHLGDPASPHFAQYGAFLAENPEFFELTKQRVASYWDCYYRRMYLSPADYPAHSLINALTRATRAHSAGA